MPDWKNVVREHIAPLRLEGSAEADLAEELAQHLEDRYGELLGAGRMRKRRTGAQWRN
jgi:hypothetical protein